MKKELLLLLIYFEHRALTGMFVAIFLLKYILASFVIQNVNFFELYSYFDRIFCSVCTGCSKIVKNVSTTPQKKKFNVKKMTIYTIFTIFTTYIWTKNHLVSLIHSLHTAHCEGYQCQFFERLCDKVHVRVVLFVDN